MSDLISRKAVIDIILELLENTEYDGDKVVYAKDKIENLPTTYDVDKVVEQLEDDRQQTLCMADESEYFLGQLALLNRVIPLVKGAVKGE